jgi:basic membrane lipoprotein Med (substrate-binding protein (PBP1-ABC) superfamily)
VADIFREILPSAIVTTQHVNANGTDVTVECNGFKLKVEVINENITSYIDTKRAYSIVSNLKNSDASAVYL